MQKKGHVCVIGAGIIGATTAYVLSRSGWTVTVIEAGQAAGMVASYANGAQLSYSYVEPLASPSVLKKSHSGYYRTIAQFVGSLNLIKATSGG